MPTNANSFTYDHDRMGLDFLWDALRLRGTGSDPAMNLDDVGVW